MTDKTDLSRRGALAKIAGLATVGYFAPTMAVMAEGHSDASASSASSVSSASSTSSASSAASNSDASDWSAPSLSHSDPEVDAALDACEESATDEASFDACLADAGIEWQR